MPQVSRSLRLGIIATNLRRVRSLLGAFRFHEPDSVQVESLKIADQKIQEALTELEYAISFYKKKG